MRLTRCRTASADRLPCITRTDSSRGHCGKTSNNRVGAGLKTRPYDPPLPCPAPRFAPIHRRDLHSIHVNSETAAAFRHVACLNRDSHRVDCLDGRPRPQVCLHASSEPRHRSRAVRLECAVAWGVTWGRSTTVSQTVPTGDGFELQEDGRMQMALLRATTAAGSIRRRASIRTSGCVPLNSHSIQARAPSSCAAVSTQCRMVGPGRGWSSASRLAAVQGRRSATCRTCPSSH